MNSPPLNQTYRIDETLAYCADVKAIYTQYENYLREVVRWVPHDTDPVLGEPGKVHVGRAYDAALVMASIDFTGFKVLELGARASFLGCYLTGVAWVQMTDLFEAENMGGLDHWCGLWTKAALRPSFLHPDRVDMRDTGYIDNSFDAVLNISAIEHVPEDGDIESVVEMARICKPGGFIVIGTDVSDQFRVAGGKYYDEVALYERLIEPSGCEIYGEVDLSWESTGKHRHKSGDFDMSSCLFVLRKGGGEDRHGIYEPREYWEQRAIRQGPSYVGPGGRVEKTIDQAGQFQEVIDRVLAGKKFNHILDFGCGVGRFVDNDWELWVSEINRVLSSTGMLLVIDERDELRDTPFDIHVRTRAPDVLGQAFDRNVVEFSTQEHHWMGFIVSRGENK